MVVEAGAFGQERVFDSDSPQSADDADPLQPSLGILIHEGRLSLLKSLFTDQEFASARRSSSFLLLGLFIMSAGVIMDQLSNTPWIEGARRFLHCCQP